MAMITNPQEIHQLIRKITDYLQGFHSHQKQLFPSIDGILILDDIIGFISEDQFLEFGMPYFKELYSSDLSIKFLHNDANCMESVRHLPEMGVNLFNMGFDTDLNQLKEMTNNQVTMLGNIPPRDVLARGSKEEIKSTTLKLLKIMDDPTRIIYSCGGGMPPGVTTEQMNTFIDTIQSFTP
jgi:uroporphyrinogen-III decarboxylase